jgi:hypothetical protein
MLVNIPVEFQAINFFSFVKVNPTTDKQDIQEEGNT